MNVNNDAMGNRISKTVTNKNETNGDKYVTTYYVRDPQGNVLAVYEHKRGESGNGTFTLTEQHLYGAGRLGMKKRDLALNVADVSESTPPATYYELTNHLGNVMAVISDKASDTNEPTVVSLSDYYPYGMTEPGRSWNSGDYRFGYTGHEKESDLAEGVYTTEYRLLDTRLGRWLSVDPLYMKYSGMSSYNYCAGNPVWFLDINGDDWILSTGDKVYWYPGEYGNTDGEPIVFDAASGLGVTEVQYRDGHKEKVDLQKAKYQIVKDGGPTVEGKYRINLVSDYNRVAEPIDKYGKYFGELKTNEEGGIEQIPPFWKNIRRTVLFSNGFRVLAPCCNRRTQPKSRKPLSHPPDTTNVCKQPCPIPL